MSDFASIGIKVDASDVEKATVSLNNLAGSGANAKSAVKEFATATGEMTTSQAKAADSFKNMQSAMNTTASGIKTQKNNTVELSDSIQKLLNKYDPLGTKLRSLESDFAKLNNAASGGMIGKNHDMAVDKTYAGLNAEMARTKELMAAASVAANDSAASMHGLGLNTQYARRELMQMGNEALNGNFSRMPQTLSSLVAHTNLLSAAMSPLGIGVIGVTAAVAAGVFAWYEWGNAAGKAGEKAEDALQKATDKAEKLRAKTLTPEENRADIIKEMIETAKEVSEAKKAISKEEERSLAARTGPTGMVTPQSMFEGSTIKKLTEASGRGVESLMYLNRELEKVNAQIAAKSDKELIAQAKWTTAEQAKITIMGIESASGDKLGSSYQSLIKLNTEQGNSLTALTAKEYEHRRGMLEEATAVEAGLIASEAERKKSESRVNSILQETTAINTRAMAQEVENATVGSTEAKRQAARIAQISKQVQDDQELITADKRINKSATEVSAIEERIKAHEREKTALEKKQKAWADMSLAEKTASNDKMNPLSENGQADSFKSSIDKPFKDFITGAQQDWRKGVNDIAKSFNNNFIDKSLSIVTDSMSKNAKIYVAIAMEVVAGSGVLNQWNKTGNANVTVAGGRDGLGGSNQQLWDRDAGWFKQKEQEFRVTNLSIKQSATFTASMQSIEQTMGSAGNALGYADARTKALSVNVTTSGDMTAALANNIADQIVPAIVLFQHEGENLQQTAQRLSETFKATNNLLSAIGVSSDKAFGGFGLQSAAARESIVSASGGLSAFNANSKGFIENFLTPAQKLAPALDDVARTFNQLGIEGVSTNEQFAALVKAQLELGNTTVVAQLLTVSDSFNSITKSAGDANKQINALLNKDMFATLVDYTRAMSQNGAGSIAGAQLSAAATAAKEQAGTAAFANKNATAIAIGATQNANDLTKMTDAPSLFQQILAVVKQLMSDLWTMLRDVFSDFVTSLRDFITSLPGAIVDGIKSFVDMLVDAIKKLIPGGGGIADVTNKGINTVTGSGTVVSNVSDQVSSWFANGGAFGASNVHAFADGGAFTNGIYNSPTLFKFASGNGFNMGVMGEAGSEAVMPLRRNAAGQLGIIAANSGNEELLAEIRMLRAELQAGQVSIATSSQKVAKTLDRWNGEGMPAVRAA